RDALAWCAACSRTHYFAAPRACPGICGSTGRAVVEILRDSQLLLWASGWRGLEQRDGPTRDAPAEYRAHDARGSPCARQRSPSEPARRSVHRPRDGRDVATHLASRPVQLLGDVISGLLLISAVYFFVRSSIDEQRHRKRER